MHYEKQIHKAQTHYINNWFKKFKHSPYGKDYISGKIDLEDLNNMLINEFLPLNWQACYVRNCEDDRVPHIANMIVKHEFGPKNLVLQNEPRCYE